MNNSLANCRRTVEWPLSSSSIWTHHKSMLGDLLKRYTPMKVMEAEDGMMLQPNRVFVIPPNCHLAVHQGKLHLLEALHSAGLHTPIDYFFRSLARDQKENAVGIILSGTGSDGVFGLMMIRDEGGMTMVQEPQTARYDGMPRNVLATGSADYSLPPDKMPEQLIAYFQHPSDKKYFIGGCFLFCLKNWYLSRSCISGSGFSFVSV
ncbi:MAG: chemotaxis protein CheB [Candidatus Syntrophopropionicum ammoniitolerans]